MNAVEVRQRRPQSIAQRAQSRRIGGSLARHSSAAFPKPTIAGTLSVPERYPRSWPPPSMSASRSIAGSRFATIERADPLRAVHLVRAERHEIDADLLNVERNKTRRLHGVAMEQRALLHAQSPQSRASGCRTPISLFADIALTSNVSARRRRAADRDRFAPHDRRRDTSREIHRARARGTGRARHDAPSKW